MRTAYVAKIFVLTLFLTFFIFPLYWMFTMAFKPEEDWASYPPKLIPNPWSLENFYKGLFVMGGLQGIIDSTIIASTNTLISLFLGSLAGYSLSRYKLGPNIAFFILSQRIAPSISFALPFFIVFSIVNLLDTHLAVIITHLTFNIPFATWIMKSFFDGIPRELDENALLDGCTPLHALMRIILPASIPGLIATSVMLFMFSWNEFLLTLFLTRSAVKPLPTLIPRFYGGHDILFGVVSAVALFAAIPPIVLVAIFQKYLVRGLTFGLVKG
ncbi:Trehalose transport system permease protein SugB [Candidatus Calditenuaceae archaeon HR02]|nr:Trehalose transport system permease protein SugB [Candidatus Calditenuaceae archaeon HR02]